MAYGDKGGAVGNDDPAFLQTDKCQKQADPDRDRVLQIMRNRIAQNPVQRGKRHNGEQHTGYDYYGKGFTPVQLHGMHKRIREKSINSHARHHHNRCFAAKSHQQTPGHCRQQRCHHSGPQRHPRIMQNSRIDHYNIYRSKIGQDACREFPFPVVARLQAYTISPNLRFHKKTSTDS
ncbi:hypothetical protein D3C75_582390 [compost metagenome]